MRPTLISPWFLLIFARVVRTTALTPASRVHVENLGDFYSFPTYLPTLPPVHVFQLPNSVASSVVVGNQVIGFDQYGILVSNQILPYPEGATADYRIVAVDSHTSDLLYSNTESTFVAVAREYLNGSGSAISVFTVLEEDTYSLFSQILTKSSVRAIQLYTDYDGNLLVAAAQKTADCTEDWESECGLSLVYKIDGFTGEADIFDAFQTGNATNVKVVTDDNAYTLTLLYSTCATMHNGWQTCRILSQVQRPGEYASNSMGELGCDLTMGQFFSVKGQSYYLGPKPSCDGSQITLWNTQLSFVNVLDTFTVMPERWFVVNTNETFCDTSLVLTAVGKDGTTIYSVDRLGEAHSKMHESEHLQIVGMWSSGEYLYCVNKSEETLTLFRMSCSKQSSLLPTTSPESVTGKNISTSTVLVNTATTTTTTTNTATPTPLPGASPTESPPTTLTTTKLPVSSQVTFLDTTVTPQKAVSGKVSSGTGATTSMSTLHGITSSRITAAPRKSTSTGTAKPSSIATSHTEFSFSESTSISLQSADDGRTINLKTNQAPWTESSHNSTTKNVTIVELLIAEARKTHLNRTLESVATSQAKEGPINEASLAGLPRNKTETWILPISSSFSLLNTPREPTDLPTFISTEKTSTRAVPRSTKELTTKALSHWDSSRDESERTTPEYTTKVPINAHSTVKARINLGVTATQPLTPPVSEIQQAVTTKAPEVTIYVGRTPVTLQSKTEATGGSALSAAYFRVPLDLESNFTSVVNTKAGSMVVIPPSPDHPCYRSASLTIGLAAVQTAAKTQFCNPAAANLSRLSIYESKVAAQFVSGNFFIASLYESTIEFVAVLKGQEALFDVHSNTTEAQYSSVAVQICEGYPTVCVLVKTCPYGRECSAEVRCYRMARFMWSTILNMTVSPDAVLHMETYSRSDRCALIAETPIYRPWTAPISATLTIYRLKSSAKGAKLLVTSQEQVEICIPPKNLRVVNVKRNIWLTTAIKDRTGTCIPGIYELLSDEKSVSGEPLKLVRQFDRKDNGQVYAVMSKDVPACVPRGDVLLMNTTGRAEAFLVDKVGQAEVSLRPMSYRNLPVNLQGQLKFVTIANHTFFMSVSGTLAITFNVICVD